MRPTLSGALVVCGGLLISLAGAADVERTPSVTTDRLPSTLSATERLQAKHWGLSESEWGRYRTLMQGIRGSISPATLSPIEVLGIHARDQTERRRYAEHWAKIMHQDAERILEFQRAYQAALARLYPGVQLVDLAQFHDGTPLGVDLNPGDRLLFFTRTGCARCDLVLSRLLDRVEAIGGLDIYLLGVPVGDDSAVRAWARSRAIPPDLVQTGVVTLNYDDGALARVSRGVAIPPYLLRQRGETLSVIQIDGS